VIEELKQLDLNVLIRVPSNFLVYPLVYPQADKNKKGLQPLSCKPLFYLARPRR
jgi:hypothetical protein